MFTKHKIGVDIDGVILDQTTQIIAFAERKFGIKMQREKMTEFSLEKTHKITRSQLHEIFSDPDYNASLQPLPNVAAALYTLQLHRFWIEIISVRYSTLFDATIESFSVHDIPYDMMFLGITDKLQHAINNGIEYFVEDRYKTAVELSKHCRTVFLMSYLYNQNRPLPDNVIPVTGWTEIVRHLTLETKQRYIGYSNGTIRKSE